MRASDRAFAATPAPLLRWGVSQFDPAVRPAARPATGGGKHHKPDAGANADAETSQWFSPGWDEKDRRKNPYAREDDKQEDN